VPTFKKTCAIKGDILLWSTLVLKRTDRVESDAQIICILAESSEAALSDPIFMTIPTFHFFFFFLSKCLAKNLMEGTNASLIISKLKCLYID
jgi:hypothetical protein